LMPIDSSSPQRVNRILPIRANLLPAEVTASRTARRTRLVLIGAAVLVVILQGLWYLYAVQQKADADAELASATQQVAIAQSRKKEYEGLTDTINQEKAIKLQLAKLLKDDLPWATTIDTVRSTGTRVGATVTEITGTLADATTGAANSDSVATLMIGGTAPDKKTIADFVDALAKLSGIANPYLTTATENKKQVDFTLTAEVTTKAVCGRYTTTCKAGGN
jgi:hypothetical protein